MAFRNRKPAAYKFSEVDGFFTLRCPSREVARDLIEKEARGYDMIDADKHISLEEVKEERMYYHKACEFYNIGDNTCGECGEPCGTNGRRTFVLYF